MKISKDKTLQELNGKKAQCSSKTGHKISVALADLKIDKDNCTTDPMLSRMPLEYYFLGIFSH